jgi:hypothetical protein
MGQYRCVFHMPGSAERDDMACLSTISICGTKASLSGTGMAPRCLALALRRNALARSLAKFGRVPGAELSIAHWKFPMKRANCLTHWRSGAYQPVLDLGRKSCASGLSASDENGPGHRLWAHLQALQEDQHLHRPCRPETRHQGGIWLVSFMSYDLGDIDLERRTLQTIDNPFGTRLLPLS